jgi:hypothetical protein
MNVCCYMRWGSERQLENQVSPCDKIAMDHGFSAERLSDFVVRRNLSERAGYRERPSDARRGCSVFAAVTAVLSACCVDMARWRRGIHTRRKKNP